jgi:uncharacterized membrane protein HdeD (DUF308 family)
MKNFEEIEKQQVALRQRAYGFAYLIAGLLLVVLPIALGQQNWLYILIGVVFGVTGIQQLIQSFREKY